MKNVSFNRSIWISEEDTSVVRIIDQRKLPFEIVTTDLKTCSDVVIAIKEMLVRGAPLIGVTAAFGVFFAVKESKEQSQPEAYLNYCLDALEKTRPTAVNLIWALKRQKDALSKVQGVENQMIMAYETACQIMEEDIENCRLIGEHGVKLIEELAARKNGEPINILTHCNAGWLACVKWGTKTSSIYQAHQKGIPVHVWVDETRPRNQGARLTAWELEQAGVPHTIIVDNAGGHLMQHGKIDLVLTGADCITREGDAANKIGTYLKALAAHDNEVPFYVAFPFSTIHWDIRDGLKEIRIEERSETEVTHMDGVDNEEIRNVRVCPENASASNYGFDVTPSKYITGFITERGMTQASEEGLLKLYPEMAVPS